MRTFGAFDRNDVYPYWFERGWQAHQEFRFSQSGYSLRGTAVSDEKAGAAPALSRISAYADVLKLYPNPPSRSLDARGQVTVDYLAQKYGESSVGSLLKASGGIAGFNSALQSVTKMSLDQLNDAVSASLR